MAVDRSQFTEYIEAGLKATTDFKKFYINFKLEGKIKQKVLDFSDKDWDKRTRIAKAKITLAEERNRQINTGLNFSENSTLNDLAEIYFSLACDKTSWTSERYYLYKLYCSTSIGKKRLRDIRQVDIDALRKKMEKRGFNIRTENGCSPRTIKKVLVQIIKPILVYALNNKVLQSIPIIKPPKQVKSKKIVKDASKKLIALYTTINTLYANDPFYRALFLFALYGRRWNEIRTLRWSDIDLTKNTYTIRAENNKIREEQTYIIPQPILQALLLIKDNHIGLVFKSYKTGLELHPPKKQIARIKEYANIPELTLHYFRHILVSAMGELGIATTILSASLGHTNLQTVNDYYLSANHVKASSAANQTIGKLLEEDKEE